MPIVSILDKKIEINLKENEIIYNGLEDQGITLQHGCLAGSCGVCKIEIIEGEKNLTPAGVIETNTINSILEDHQFSGKIVRLSCRAKIIGDIKIRELKKN